MSRTVSPQAAPLGPGMQALLTVMRECAPAPLKQDGCVPADIADSGSAGEGRTIRILDLNGAELAIVALTDGLPDARFLYIARVERGGGQLLNYRFGEGQHKVLLECEDWLQPARIATRWSNNRRQWRLEPVAPHLAYEPFAERTARLPSQPLAAPQESGVHT